MSDENAPIAAEHAPAEDKTTRQLRKSVSAVPVPEDAIGGCAGAHKRFVEEGAQGTFFMRSAPVPKIEPPPPVPAQPLPGNDELYVICEKRDLRDRYAKSFPLMRYWDDGKTRPWDVFIGRMGKTYFAYVNECPHTGGRLDWEKNNFFEPNFLKTLMCGKHGAQFDTATGVCIKGPCEGKALQKVEVVIDEDDVCLTGVNLDLDAQVGEAAVDPNVDTVLENNGFKLQSTKRTFSN